MAELASNSLGTPRVDSGMACLSSNLCCRKETKTQLPEPTKACSELRSTAAPSRLCSASAAKALYGNYFVLAVNIHDVQRHVSVFLNSCQMKHAMVPA